MSNKGKNEHDQPKKKEELKDRENNRKRWVKKSMEGEEDDDELKDLLNLTLQQSEEPQLEDEKSIAKAEKETPKKKSTSDEEEKVQEAQPHVRPSGKEDAPDTTATLEPLAHASAKDWLGDNRDPDVMLSVPNLGIDHIGLKVKNLYAHIDLNAQVLDLVKLHVGADIGIEEVDLQINNVRVQAMLKVKLEKVREIVGDVVGFLDNHPEILGDLTGGLGRGLEGALNRGGEVDNLSGEEKTKLRKMLEESDEKEESDKKDKD